MPDPSDVSGADTPASFRIRFNENLSPATRRTRLECEHQDDLLPLSPSPTYDSFSQAISTAYTSTPVARGRQTMLKRARDLSFDDLHKPFRQPPDRKARKPGIYFQSLKERRKTKFDNFSRYIYKVHKSVNPDLEISLKTVRVMESFINDMFDRLATEVVNLKLKTQTKRINAVDFEAAIKLVLPPELARYACEEGREKLKKYHQNQ